MVPRYGWILIKNMSILNKLPQKEEETAETWQRALRRMDCTSKNYHKAEKDKVSLVKREAEALFSCSTENVISVTG